MKKVLLIILIFAAFLANAQNSELSKIESAIKAGNADQLSALFANTVEVTVPGGEEKDYAKNQATFVIKEFFQKNSVKSFSILHKGNSANTYYAVGKYVASTGTYDTNIFLKKSGSAYLISQIRFEK